MEKPLREILKYKFRIYDCSQLNDIKNHLFELKPMFKRQGFLSVNVIPVLNSEIILDDVSDLDGDIEISIESNMFRYELVEVLRELKYSDLMLDTLNLENDYTGLRPNYHD